MITKYSIAVTIFTLLALLLGCSDTTFGPTSGDQAISRPLSAIDAEELDDDDPGHYQHRHNQDASGMLVWYSASTGAVTYSHRFIYSYSDGTLELDQTSYLPGCCPGDLIVDFDITRSSIRISERPVWDGPMFMVLSHLEARIEITDLPAREYEVRVDYADSGLSYTFVIDLINAPSGQRCFAL